MEKWKIDILNQLYSNEENLFINRADGCMFEHCSAGGDSDDDQRETGEHGGVYLHL